MKNYHAVGIAICAAVIITCALSLTDTVHAAESDKRPPICPTATQDNSGYIVTDEDRDGKPDTIWHVYTSGICLAFQRGDALLMARHFKHHEYTTVNPAYREGRECGSDSLTSLSLSF